MFRLVWRNGFDDRLDTIGKGRFVDDLPAAVETAGLPASFGSGVEDRVGADTVPSSPMRSKLAILAVYGQWPFVLANRRFRTIIWHMNANDDFHPYGASLQITLEEIVTSRRMR